MKFRTMPERKIFRIEKRLSIDLQNYTVYLNKMNALSSFGIKLNSKLLLNNVLFEDWVKNIIKNDHL
jgi:hypothetical protein